MGMLDHLEKIIKEKKPLLPFSYGGLETKTTQGMVWMIQFALNREVAFILGDYEELYQMHHRDENHPDVYGTLVF